MKLEEETQSTWRKHCLCVNLLNTKLAMNPGLRGDTPASNRLRHGTSDLTDNTNCLNYKANLLTLFGQGSSVGIATGYGLDGPGIESRWRRDFPHLSRPPLGPALPLVQLVPGPSRG